MIRILSEKIHRYRFLISASSTALKRLFALMLGVGVDPWATRRG